MDDRKKRTVRVIVLVSSEELAAIEDFRFGNRMPNKAEAARELLRRGLASIRDEPNPPH